jgi:putative membrane protein
MAADTAKPAVQRTFLVHERTLMAWVRTSTSLISFGFSIYKFFAYVVEVEGRAPQRKGIGPREFAIGMISLGVFTLVTAVIHERRAFKLLEAQNNTAYSSLAEKIAALIALAGLFLLILALLRR